MAWVTCTVLLLLPLLILVQMGHFLKGSTSQVSVDFRTHLIAPKESENVTVPFTAHLKYSSDDSQLTQALRAFAFKSVVISDVRLTESASTTEILGRTEMTATIRGTYPAIKLLLKDLIGRFEASNFRQLHIRLLNPPAEVEANLTFVVWSPPLTPRRIP